MVLWNYLVIRSLTQATNRAQFCTYYIDIILFCRSFFILFLQTQNSLFKLALLAMKQFFRINLCDLSQLAILDSLVETEHFVHILGQHLFLI
jgi:hypothetical protein